MNSLIKDILESRIAHETNLSRLTFTFKKRISVSILWAWEILAQHSKPGTTRRRTSSNILVKRNSKEVKVIAIRQKAYLQRFFRIYRSVYSMKKSMAQLERLINRRKNNQVWLTLRILRQIAIFGKQVMSIKRAKLALISKLRSQKGKTTASSFMLVANLLSNIHKLIVRRHLACKRESFELIFASYFDFDVPNARDLESYFKILQEEKVTSKERAREQVQPQATDDCQ